MSTIELTPEQERTLAREGVVELPDLVVMTPETYRRAGIRCSRAALLPDPPLDPVEIDLPVELPLSGTPTPVAVSINYRSHLLPGRYPRRLSDGKIGDLAPD